jgi:hypothetical protein
VRGTGCETKDLRCWQSERSNQAHGTARKAGMHDAGRLRDRATHPKEVGSIWNRPRNRENHNAGSAPVRPNAENKLVEFDPSAKRRDC